MTNDEKDIVHKLFKFRWKYHAGTDQYNCSSCGALAEAYWETASIKRLEPCSKTCPWFLVEELIESPA